MYFIDMRSLTYDYEPNDLIAQEPGMDVVNPSVPLRSEFLDNTSNWFTMDSTDGPMSTRTPLIRSSSRLLSHDNNDRESENDTTLSMNSVDAELRNIMLGGLKQNKQL